MPLDSDVVSAKKSEQSCLLTRMEEVRKWEEKLSNVVWRGRKKEEEGRGRSVGKVAEGPQERAKFQGKQGFPAIGNSPSTLQRSPAIQPAILSSPCGAHSHSKAFFLLFCPRCR